MFATTQCMQAKSAMCMIESDLSWHYCTIMGCI